MYTYFINIMEAKLIYTPCIAKEKYRKKFAIHFKIFKSNLDAIPGNTSITVQESCMKRS